MMYGDNPKLSSYLKSLSKKIVSSGEFAKQLDKVIIEAYFKGREDLYNEIELKSKALKEIKNV